MSTRLDCELHARLQADGRVCEDSEAACSAEIQETIDELGGISEARACYRELYRQARRYLGNRVGTLSRGERRAKGASRFVSSIERRCRNDSLELGGECSGISDPRPAALCLRAVLESIAQRVTGIVVRPNIVLVVTDDQRFDTLSFMPHVSQRLVGAGSEFPEAFVATAMCCPTRATIFTGLRTRDHGVLGGGSLILGTHNFDIDQTIGTFLQAGGYRTGYFGKLFANGAVFANQVPAGWDHWEAFTDGGGYYDYTLNTNGQHISYGNEEKDYSTDLLALHAREFLEADPAEPFFLYFAPFAPHAPFVPADRHEGAFAFLPPYTSPNLGYSDVARKPNWLRYMHWAHPVGFLEEQQDKRRQQLEMLLAVDEAVAAIDAQLERHGLLDNTLVLFTSDNGLHWGEHWWTSKFSSYEESIRVPMVVRYPRRFRRAQTLDDGLALSLDIAQTLLDAAGVVEPYPMKGQSLLSFMEGAAPRDHYLIENTVAYIVQATEGVRSTTLKYFRESSGEQFEELYDLSVDPYELNNLAADPLWAQPKAMLLQLMLDLQAE